MNMKLLATTALAASLISGIAYAQSTPDDSGQVGASTTSESNDATTDNGAMKSDNTMKSDDTKSSSMDSDSDGMEYKSDDEQSMYEDMSDQMAGFFTDDSMTSLKSDEEVKKTFQAMGADDQAGMKTACERAMSNRGSYGTVTVGLCQQIGAL